MRKPIFAAALCALLGASGCATVNVDTVWDTQFRFAGANTFDWAPKEPEAGEQLDYGSIDTAVKTAVERHLVAAGFRRSSDDPELLATYYVGTEEVTAIGSDYYGRGWGGYWGWGWYGPAGLNVSQYDVGTITVDFLSPDPEVGLVWRGIARAGLTRAAQSSNTIRSAIGKILEDFPPPDED